jgi:predicted secreted protein
MMMNRYRLAVVVAGLMAATMALAEPLQYNVVNLQASARREVPQDLLRATLFVESQDSDPAALNKRLNTWMNEALQDSRAFATVKVSSGNRQSWPVYGKQGRTIEGWRSRAELRLESRDFAAAGLLLAKLQKQLQIGQLDFSLSDSAMQQAEAALLTDALAAFRAKAQVVQGALGSKGYRVVQIHVQPGMEGSPPPMVAMRKGMLAAAAMPAPEVEGGEMVVSVTVQGSIQLID